MDMYSTTTSTKKNNQQCFKEQKRHSFRYLPCRVLSQGKASNDTDYIFFVLKTSIAQSHLFQNRYCSSVLRANKEKNKKHLILESNTAFLKSGKI